MFILTAVVVSLVVGVIAHQRLFAERPPGRRVAYSVALAVLTPALLFLLLAALVGMSFLFG